MGLLMVNYLVYCTRTSDFDECLELAEHPELACLGSKAHGITLR